MIILYRSDRVSEPIELEREVSEHLKFYSSVLIKLSVSATRCSTKVIQLIMLRLISSRCMVIWNHSTVLSNTKIPILQLK
jgi:hypothetical protein